MNIVIWMLSGAIVGRLGYSVAGLNDARAKRVSIVIGALGGVVGGSLAAPIFTAAAAPGDFSLPALCLAATMSAAALFVSNLVHNRRGV
ncbi:MAG TPA: hypothetical protein VNU96_16985 [Burkholderiales bacterium]|jgi:uncharacterized membrane protein YeaQ/YmgE (transglycosylase-associated protein family)|nr:hypothetical protein [Burkholderiales bacterium]